ncbi:uncharacterized protein JCM6883_000035 [Sporobolomyces salmoneus]|uniref:uncharacterized protein n=1 Tax=Sporobolomyces salmoneus TaxID=183962 RepID=UPI00318008FF
MPKETASRRKSYRVNPHVRTEFRNGDASIRPILDALLQLERITRRFYTESPEIRDQTAKLFSYLNVAVQKYVKDKDLHEEGLPILEADLQGESKKLKQPESGYKNFLDWMDSKWIPGQGISVATDGL